MEGTALGILQARMGSVRLPGKVLLPIIGGRSTLEIMLERASRSRRLSSIIVATTTLEEDNPIVELCLRLGYDYFRGSSDDLLDRYYRAALEQGRPDAIVRLTGDCPLIDPEIVDLVVDAFLEGNADYMSNFNPPSYPDGLDVEVLRFTALEKAWAMARRPADREHVNEYIFRHPEMFSQDVVRCSEDYSHYRWTLDERCDYEFIKAVFGALYTKNQEFGMRDVMAYLRDRPDVQELNSHIRRNEGLLRSLEKEG